MVEQQLPSSALDPACLALGIVAIVHVAAVVFSESYLLLPPVLAAYVPAWWIVRRATR